MTTSPIVLDLGTGFIKAGYAGNYTPSHCIASMVGRPILRVEEKANNDNIALKEVMCGNEAAKYRRYLDIYYPVENGIVRDWDNMDHLLDHTLNDCLKISTSNRNNVLFSEAPCNPFETRKKMYERMIEKYDFDNSMTAIQAVLSLYSQGLLTGCIVDSGDGVTYVIPVYEGYGLPNCIQRMNIAGRHITRYLIQLLRLRGYEFLHRSADFDTARQIKENLCFVAYDLEKERRLSLETTVLEQKFKLPDGKIIKVERERFEACEVLYNPAIAGVSAYGLDNMVFRAIMKCDIDLRAEFFKHIVLSGGTTSLPGFSSRLTKEVKQCWVTDVAKGDASRLSKFKLRIEDPARRKNMVWLGGSVLADIMKDHNAFWLNKEDWNEKGAVRAIKEHHNIRCSK